ncbi:hypothetical protein CIHG_04828 [Coccidioides immitis H538.4]|uniref:Uncharacterized protein n=2 Tax=Coccidioides immitis TaxID=5501 RepID=A0A0J8RSG4_COCIT|nr:hypothetical protein CIRG_05340 [Coccidioides immitis RMSCC 2394]KMU86889.1 hypothetical protein CIHG_04828 [Coccidioides immitis H538.4]
MKYPESAPAANCLCEKRLHAAPCIPRRLSEFGIPEQAMNYMQPGRLLAGFPKIASENTHPNRMMTMNLGTSLRPENSSLKIHSSLSRYFPAFGTSDELVDGAMPKPTEIRPYTVQWAWQVIPC